MPSTVEEQPASPALERTLGVVDATLINVGTIVGSGIFAAGTAVAANVVSVPMFFIVWLVAALFSLLGALSIAELGAALPNTGGMFVYLREAYGPIWGYLYGWAECAVILAAGNAAVAVLFATYAAQFVAMSALQTKLVASAIILALTGMNVLGVRIAAWANNAMTVLKIALILFLAIAAFVHPPIEATGAANGASAGVPLTPPSPALTFAVFGSALLQPLWSFDGWAYAGCVAGEMRKPSRDLPIATILSVVIVGAVYALLNASFIHALGLGGVARAELVTSTVATHALGSSGATFALGLVMLAVAGSLNGGIITGPRVLYAMAERGMFFRAAGRVHRKFRTPAVALVLLGVWSIALVFTGRYDQLLTAALFTSWLFYGMSGAAVIVLRKKRPDLPRPYRAVGYPVAPVLFVAFASIFLIQTIASDPRDAAIGLGLVLAGIGPYFYFKKRNRPEHITR